MPNIYLDYSLKCINSKPTKGKAPQLEGTFVRREFSLKIELFYGFMAWCRFVLYSMGLISWILYHLRKSWVQENFGQIEDTINHSNFLCSYDWLGNV